MARICEASEVEPPRAHVGDTILVRLRYDSPETRKVLATTILPTNLTQIAGTVDCDKISTWLERLSEARLPLRFHEQSYHVDKLAQIGKDLWTDDIPDWAIEWGEK